LSQSADSNSKPSFRKQNVLFLETAPTSQVP
jgi:hypothetical protein